MPVLRWLRPTLACLSIAANALCAGGIFTFPLLSPALASRLKLTQPQLTTIVLAGVIGQYPFAALVGKIIDRYGPSTCSLAASILFSTAYSMFAYEIEMTPDDISQPSTSSFHRLAIFFSMAGLGTVFSYFSSLFAASKNFPDYPGIASGASMSLFGLSPLFLSLFASSYFTNHESGSLNIVSFLKFVAILTGSIHMIGVFNLRTPPPPSESNHLPSNDPEVPDTNESTSLLPGKPNVGVNVEPLDECGHSSLDLLRDRNFWILVTLVSFTLGACEMVLSNIGTITLSLPTSKLQLLDSSTETASNQVRILSVSNTLSRLVAGSLADFVSPVASYLHTGVLGYRRHRFGRVAFLSAATLLLATTFFWMEVGVQSRDDVWVLSVGTGICYGVTFTVLPSIVSSVWGLSDLGRNFGIITYAPFVGTPLFSYLYAFVSASNAQDGRVCEGHACWQLTFWVSFGTSLLAFFGTMILWKRWKGMV